MDMMISELLHLWDEYRLTNPPAHKLTFTDFMEYIKSHQFGDVVKQPESDDLNRQSFEAARNHLTTLYDGSSQEPGTNVSKRRLATGITKDEVKQIRKLYEQGYSLARIRERLGLDVSLNRLQTVVNKPW